MHCRSDALHKEQGTATQDVITRGLSAQLSHGPETFIVGESDVDEALLDELKALAEEKDDPQEPEALDDDGGNANAGGTCVNMKSAAGELEGDDDNFGCSAKGTGVDVKLM